MPTISLSGPPLGTPPVTGLIGSPTPPDAPAPSAKDGQPVTQAKTEHGPAQAGFNPAISIDPDTHIVVMTVSAPDGETIRQIPNQHELAAYKARAADHKKGGGQT